MFPTKIVFFFAWAVAIPTADASTHCLKPNHECQGKVLAVVPVDDPANAEESCVEACRRMSGCTHVTLYEDVDMCALFGSCTPTTSTGCSTCLTGKVPCGEQQCDLKGMCQGHCLHIGSEYNEDMCQKSCHSLEGCEYYTYDWVSALCYHFRDCPGPSDDASCTLPGTCISGQSGCVVSRENSNDVIRIKTKTFHSLMNQSLVMGDEEHYKGEQFSLNTLFEVDSVPENCSVWKDPKLSHTFALVTRPKNGRDAAMGGFSGRHFCGGWGQMTTKSLDRCLILNSGGAWEDYGALPVTDERLPWGSGAAIFHKGWGIILTRGRGKEVIYIPQERPSDSDDIFKLIEPSETLKNFELSLGIEPCWVAVNEDTLFFVGSSPPPTGDNGKPPIKSRAFVYRKSTDVWTEIESLPGRYEPLWCGAVNYGRVSEVVVAGGEGDDTMIYNIGTKAWRKAAHNFHSDRFDSLISASFGATFLLLPFGGHSAYGYKPHEERFVKLATKLGAPEEVKHGLPDEILVDAKLLRSLRCQ